jgi:VanZ family protein
VLRYGRAMTARSLDIAAFWGTALIAVTITTAMLMPGTGRQPDIPGIDKVQHFLAFLALTFPVCARRPRAVLWIVPAAIVLGGAIELIQPLTGRTREAADFVADTAGAVVGALLGLRLARRGGGRGAR